MFAQRGGTLQANKLIIRLQPDEYVRLLVMAKEPGLDREGIHLREVPLDLSLDAQFAGTRRRIAYERLLLRSEEHTSELQSLMRISYAVFCLKKTTKTPTERRCNQHSS